MDPETIIITTQPDHNNIDNNTLLPLSQQINHPDYVGYILHLLKILIQISYLITGVIIFLLNIDTTCNDLLPYLPLIISLNSFLTIIHIIDSKLISRSDLSRIRHYFGKFILTFNKLVSMFIIGYAITYFIFTDNCNQHLPQVFHFLIAYLIIEYLLIGIIILLLFIIIRCGVRLFFPHLVLRLFNEFPMRLGATDEDLLKLNSYSFEDGFLNNSTTRIPLTTEDAQCSICMDTYNNVKLITILPCSHHFHKDCCQDWLKINQSCPLCRQDIVFH